MLDWIRFEKEAELSFCITIDPNVVPDNIKVNNWDNFLDDCIIANSLRTVELLHSGKDVKMILIGDYCDVKGFLNDLYGCVNYSNIYLWNAKAKNLINEWKISGDKKLWELI